MKKRRVSRSTPWFKYKLKHVKQAIKFAYAKGCLDGEKGTFRNLLYKVEVRAKINDRLKKVMPEILELLDDDIKK